MNINKLSRNKNYYNITNDYIAGLFHADGCFSASIQRSIKNKNLYIIPELTFSQHIDNKEIVLLIKKKFNCGNIYYQPNNQIRYKVKKLEDLKNIIIPFFEKHQVRSNKYMSFLKFKLLVNILYIYKPKYPSNLWLYCMLLKTELNPLTKLSTQLRYLTQHQIEDIKNKRIPNFEELKNSIDLNIYKELKELKTDYNEVEIPNSKPITKDFINGIIDGDGSISVSLKKTLNNVIIIEITLEIIQDSYNKSLLNEIKIFLNNKGNIRPHKTQNSISYFLTKKDLKSVLPKLLNNINNLDWTELEGPNIKLYKFYNVLKIYNILEKEKLNNYQTQNIILNYNYNIIKNPSKLSLIDYKKKVIERLKDK